MHRGNLENYVARPFSQAQMLPQQKSRHGSIINNNTIKKYGLLFLMLATVLFTGWQGFLYIEDNIAHSSSRSLAQSAVVGDNIAISGLSKENIIPRRPTQSAVHYQRPDFEAGIVFPQWTADGYGPDWQQQLPTMQAQSGARWTEMTVFFSQATTSSMQVTTNSSTPTVESFSDGIKAARALGYHVFVVPLMGVDTPAGQWAGTIQFSNYQDEAQWFDSYWQVFQPYVAAAAQAGADELAIGTELVWLQQAAPPALWNTLISRIHSVFPGTLTYDMNWSSLKQPLANWLSNPQLSRIGVSEYLPLVSDRIRVNPNQIFGMWKTIVKSALDNLAIHLNKPVIISEIGYRNSADTLYDSWSPSSTVSPPDPEEQAAACDAALANVIPDSHIAGVFFWGWDGVGGFKLSGQPAIHVLNKWYTSPQS
ncbi:MAG: hypothetical protein NVSMB33_09400 [Ktedonobacteraceae bacterium]